uniref:Uncharacterized protein n=1 Tax=Graphocephala atropunctata TaxID=36148 RepID=A0A1B6KFL3_9HEMI
MVLALQSNSLKNLVAITKDLLTVKNTEVEQLVEDQKRTEEKINLEKNRHEKMLNTMSESAKLNEDIRAQYYSQVDLFNELRARYEEKVALLEVENRDLTDSFTEWRTNMFKVKQTSNSNAGVQTCDDSGVETGEKIEIEWKQSCKECGRIESNLELNNLSEHCYRKPQGDFSYGEVKIEVLLDSKIKQSSRLGSEANTNNVTADNGVGEGEVQLKVINSLEADNEPGIAQVEMENNLLSEIFEGSSVSKALAEQTGNGEGSGL